MSVNWISISQEIIVFHKRESHPSLPGGVPEGWVTLPVVVGPPPAEVDLVEIIIQ